MRGATSGTIALVLLLIGLFVPHAELLAVYWRSASSHGMGSLVAVLAALVLLWSLLPLRPGSRPRPSFLRFGYLALACLLALYVANLLVWQKRSLVGYGATGILATLVYLQAGRSGLWQLRYPLALALFAAPLPGLVLEAVDAGMIDLATAAGATVLGWYQDGVVREGYFIRVTEWKTVQVVPDCSGLAGVLLFVPLAIVLSFYYPRLTPLGRIGLLCSALPLALLGNLLRIVLTGVLLVHDIEETETFHEVSGIVSLSLAMGAMFLIALWLDGSPRSRRPLALPDAEGVSTS
jgi:exosortase